MLMMLFYFYLGGCVCMLGMNIKAKETDVLGIITTSFLWFIFPFEAWTEESYKSEE